MTVLKTRKFLTAVLSLICAALLGFAVFASVNTKLTADALSSPSATVGELYNDSTGKFSKDNLNDLAVKLLGNGKKAGDLLTATESGAIKASGFATQNLEIKFGGMSWTPVYLATSDEAVVLTLWLCQSAGTSKFSNNGNNMYGSSYIRAVTLNNGGTYYTNSTVTTTATKSTSNAFARFTMSKSDLNTALTDYLLTPEQVKWQGEESAKAQGDGFDSYRDDQPNDSYLRDKNISNSTMKTYQDATKYPLYDQWKSDYVWLPSLTELGGVKNNGLWKPTKVQRTQTDTSWLRTASYCQTGHVMTNLAGGTTHYIADTGSSLGVRPCIHLNLTEVLGGRVDDVETVYNGSAQTLADIEADQKYWYNSEIMDITPLTTPMKDAGTYVVRVDLKQDAIDNGKEFLGNPDPSKGAGDESGTRRYINFKIKPKELSATLSVSNGVVTFTPDSSGLCGSDSLPNTAIQYTSTDGKGYNSTTAPQVKGDFKAEPKITDAKSNYSLKCTPASVTFTVTAVQVEEPTLPQTAAPVYNGKAQKITLNNYKHDGKGVKILSVDGKTASNKNVATAPSPDSTKGEITFTDAGTYTVTVVLEDTANCVWKSDGSTGRKELTFTVNPKKLGVTLSNDNGNLWSWGMGTAVKTTVTLSGIETTDVVKLTSIYTTSGGTDTKSNGTANTLGDTTVSDELTLPNNLLQDTYSLTAEIDNENYSISDGLTSAGMPMSFTIGAQVFDPSTFGWTYAENGTGSTAIAEGGSLKYKMDATGKPYEYTLSVNTGAFTSVFQTLTDTDYTNRKQTNAGTYTTTVHLTIKNTDYSFDTTKTYANATIKSTTEADVFINWTIEKGDFTGLENLPWVYKYGASGSWTDYNPARPPEFGNGTVTVKMKGDVEGTLKGLTFNYGGVNAERNKGDYTVKMSFGVTDSANFNIPQGFDFDWKISKKVISVQWEQDVALTYTGTAHPEWNGNDYFATQLRYEKPEFADKVEYIYSCTLPDGTAYSGRGIEALAYVTEQALAAQRRVMVDVTVELKSDASIQNDYDLTDPTGGNFATSFMVGDSKLVAKVELTADGEYGSFNYTVNVTGEDMDGSKYSVQVYKGTNINDVADPANTLIENFDPTTADAGDYFIVVTLTGDWANEYRLSGAKKTFTIAPKKVAVPTLGEVTFTGSGQNIADYLGGSWNDYKDLITLGGDFENIRDVSVNGYVATLTLTNTNYQWDYSQGETAPTKLVLTDSEVTVDGTAQQANYKWNVAPLVIDTSKMWNMGKDGASLKLPENVQALISGGTLELGYRYYDSDGNFIENPELKGGKQYKVDAVFGGDDSLRNVMFKTADGNIGSTAPVINYTVPQSGAAAFFGNAVSFLKSNWLWFLIGFLVLLFLIILIIVIAKRRKHKEERLAKKEAKEEEKRRKEEEREEEKRRREQERELEKAKAEAELAKMRAGLGLGAGAAGMAMAAQQQPVQQVQPVQQPVQQTVDNNAIARLEAEIAAMRAEQRMQQQNYMSQQMPMQSADSSAIARLEAQINAMQAEQRAKYDAEQRAEFAAMRAEQRMDREAYQRAEMAAMREQLNGRSFMPDRYMAANMPAQNAASQSTAMDMLGALVVSALKSITTGNKSEERVQPSMQLTESSSPTAVETPTVYPPDAVITTTTTVDTTKPKSEPVSRDDEKNFDIDGFYDTFDKRDV